MSKIQDTYNKRTWLDESSHSTSHIVCYFDKNCLNNSLALFIKISDCTESWYLIDNGTAKYINDPKKSLGFINNLIDVFKNVLNTVLVKKTITNKVFNIQRNVIKLTLYKESGLINLKVVTRTGEFVNVKTRRKFKWKTRVCLHSDKETCNEEVFISKINKIIIDLENFKTFLINI